MNKLLTIFSFVLFLTVLGCKKAPGPADGKSVQPNNHLDSTVSISASIDGVNWQTDSVFANNVQPSGNDSTRINLMITATQKNTNSTMEFYISNFTGANTYPINPPLNTVAYYTGNIRHWATSGQITITINTIVVGMDTAYALIGAFNFTTADTLTVTDGKFNVVRP